MSVLQESGANTADVSTAFKEALEELLEKDEFKGVKADIIVRPRRLCEARSWKYRSILTIGRLFAMLVLFLLPYEESKAQS